MSDPMTLEELAKEINRKETSIIHNWKRLQESLAKKGVIVYRAGTGASAKYYVEYKPQ